MCNLFNYDDAEKAKFGLHTNRFPYMLRQLSSSYAHDCLSDENEIPFQFVHFTVSAGGTWWHSWLTHYATSW
jgi:hypothetical protein